MHLHKVNRSSLGNVCSLSTSKVSVETNLKIQKCICRKKSSNVHLPLPLKLTLSVQLTNIHMHLGVFGEEEWLPSLLYVRMV
jgi:hypothetical protein